MSLSPTRTGDAGGQIGRLGRLVRKELNEILRDRRTIITLVLMPLLLYPLLSLAFQQFLLAGQQRSAPAEYWLGFASRAEFVRIQQQLGWKLDSRNFELTPLSTESAPAGTTPALRVRFPINPQEVKDPAYLDKLLLSRSIDVAVREAHRPARPTASAPPGALELVYLADSSRGQEVAAWMERQAALANVQLLRELRAQPLVTIRTPTRDPEQKGGNFLAALVPLILILMTITGAVYPAIDLTAGERERGTLEILVAAPVPRLGLLFAKYVTVLTVAVLTALVNLVMMIVTLLATGLAAQPPEGTWLSPLVIAEMFGLLLLFAAFFSGVLLTITSFARSFKEAQAYLVPLMLASLAPGLIGMIPGLELSGLLSVVPLINIVLLTRDLLDPVRSVDPAAAVVVVLSTLLYAAAALSLAARIFGAEAVLYSEQGGWSDLFRRPAETSPTATVTGALCCVALMFPADFLLQAFLGRSLDLPAAGRLALQVAITAVLFGAFPWIAAARGRVRLRTGLQLSLTSGPALAGAAVLGVSLWPFALSILLALGSFGLGPEHQEAVQKLLAEWRRLGPGWIVLANAVVPAVFEELFFRGYLFSALRARSGLVTTILATAGLFGLFHSFFTPGQVLTSTLLGIVLGAVCWRTGSVLPGIVIHVIHNSLVFLALYYQEDLRQQGWLDLEGAQVPVNWMLLAAGGLALGAGLLWFGTWKGRRPTKPEEVSLSV
jgi:ABC-2 type transport system permease protein/sodium transport system permease protein